MEMSMIDLSTLSVDDIKEEYLQLYERYRQQRVDSEADAQRIHELKRSLDTALAAEEYLTQELEQTTSSAYDAALAQAQNALEDLRRKHNMLLQEHAALQQSTEQTVLENERLTSALAAKNAVKSPKKLEDEEKAAMVARERNERLRLLEEENLELLQKLDEEHERTVRHVMAINDKEGTIEMLRDRLHCLEENLSCKRDELEEKTQLLESAQEQLGEANARIAMLITEPESEERKGNSLFAEVDDQRQAMKHLLAAQKRSYMEMKKIYQDSQYEIRRLKNENIAMHNELEACSTLFCSSNKAYQNKLLERLRHINNEKEVLERELQLMHDRLRDLTNNKGVGWLDSMLNFCKEETNELKKQMHSSRIQQASLEEQLRNSSQDLARWRFEALKSRCLLLDRENLLHHNNISFKVNTAVEFRVTDQQLQEARPRIATPAKPLLPLSEFKEEKREPLISNDEDSKSPEQMLAKIMNMEPKETVKAKKEEPASPTTEQKEILSAPSTPQQSADMKLLPCADITNSPRADELTSILCKPRDILASEATKSVTFSNASPVVHELSPPACNDENIATKTKEETATKTVRQIRTKSGIIVRHVVFGASKQLDN